MKVAALFIAFLAIFLVSQTSALQCYTGYTVVRGQTVGTNTVTCPKSSDQCYKAKTSLGLVNKLKLAGCSTYRCMAASNKCTNQNIAGQSIELCCCNNRDLCNGQEQNVVTNTANKIKDKIFGNLFGGGNGR